MVRTELRTALVTVCRIAARFGQKDNADAITARLRRDDLAAWLSDEMGYGAEVMREIRGGLDTGLALAVEFNSPELQRDAKIGIRAYESASLLVDELVRTGRKAMLPAANRNGSSRLSLVMPAAQPAVIASEDGLHVVALPVPSAVRTGTIPAGPNGGRAA